MLHEIPFKYVLTIDEDYVARAFSDYYKIDIDEAHRYLAKFIQIKYHFPARRWDIFVRNILNLFSDNRQFFPDGSDEDFSSFLEYFNIDSSRDAHRVLSYLILWQKRFFDPQPHTSVMYLIKNFSEKDKEIEEILIKSVNCILFVFAVIQVRYPSHVSIVLRENLIQKISKQLSEAKKELERFKEKIVNRRMNSFYIEPAGKVIETVDRKFLDAQYSEGKKKRIYSLLEEIIIEIFNR
jgi:hypothetical protein